MFIGVDHGTTAIRFATKHAYFEIPRRQAANLNEEALFAQIQEKLGIGRSDIKMFAVTYSMGDGIKHITPIEKTTNRGLITQTGAGLHTGGGTRIFDIIHSSKIPAVVIPGIHKDSGFDERLNIYSHGTSPEKIGIAYHIYKKGTQDFIMCDISSNTVTLAVAHGRILGALDACILAPGIHHGPLDVEAIRAVDSQQCTANEAFTRAGVIKRTPYHDLAELTRAYEQGEKDAATAFNTLALLSSMEITAMTVLAGDYGVQSKDCRVYLSGSISEMKPIIEQIQQHLHTAVTSVGRESAAIGLAEIAEDVHNGTTNILGISVEK